MLQALHLGLAREVQGLLHWFVSNTTITICGGFGCSCLCSVTTRRGHTRRQYYESGWPSGARRRLGCGGPQRTSRTADGGRGLLLKAASANFTRLHLQTLQLRVRPEHYERKLLLCLLRCMGMFSRGGEGESTERPSRVHALFSLAHSLLGAA